MEIRSGSVDLLSGENLSGLEYAYGIFLLCNDSEVMRFALNQLIINIHGYGMHFASPKYKVLLNDDRSLCLHLLLVVTSCV